MAVQDPNLYPNVSDEDVETQAHIAGRRAGGALIAKLRPVLNEQLGARMLHASEAILSSMYELEYEQAYYGVDPSSKASDEQSTAETESEPRRILSLVPERSPDGHEIDILSPAETKVLELIAQGHQYQEVAQELGCSRISIDGLTQNIYKKLHAKNKSNAVRLGFEKGVLIKPSVDYMKLISLEPLSDVELQTLEAISKGLIPKYIAFKSHYATRTIEGRLQRIFGKLKARNRVDAVRIAIELDILKIGVADGT